MSLKSRFIEWLATHGYMGESRKEAERLANAVSVQSSLITSLKKQNKVLKEENEILRARTMEYHTRLRKMTKELITVLEKQKIKDTDTE